MKNASECSTLMKLSLSSLCGAKPVGFLACCAWWLIGGKRLEDREVHIINILPRAISKG